MAHYSNAPANPSGQPPAQPPEPEPPPVARYEGRIRPRTQVTSAGDSPAWRQTRVTVGNDGDAGPPVSSRPRTKPGPRSPESYPVTQSTTQRALRQRLIREHAKQAEDHAQAAYDQSRAALELISRSMESVHRAFSEAKHARISITTSSQCLQDFARLSARHADCKTSSARPRRHDVPTLPPIPRASAPPPIVRAELKPAVKPMTSPPAGPQYAAGDRSSSPNWCKRSSPSAHLQGAFLCPAHSVRLQSQYHGVLEDALGDPCCFCHQLSQLQVHHRCRAITDALLASSGNPTTQHQLRPHQRSLMWSITGRPTFPHLRSPHD